MTSPTAHFEDAFDRIEVDPSTAPSRAAIESAFAICAPPDTKDPGFYLLDDAGGRFVIDRDFGVISLKDEALLAREQGQIHTAHLKVVEPSGAVYDLQLRLKLTGLVPQVLGYEHDAAVLSGATLPTPVRPRAPTVPWELFSAARPTFREALSRGQNAPYGAVFCPKPPAGSAVSRFEASRIEISLAPAHADWSV